MSSKRTIASKHGAKRSPRLNSTDRFAPVPAVGQTVSEMIHGEPFRGLPSSMPKLPPLKGDEEIVLGISNPDPMVPAVPSVENMTLDPIPVPQLKAVGLDPRLTAQERKSLWQKFADWKRTARSVKAK